MFKLFFCAHEPEVSYAIHHHPQCFVTSHCKCQSDAASGRRGRPHLELASDTHDPASRPTFVSQYVKITAIQRP